MAPITPRSHRERAIEAREMIMGHREDTSPVGGMAAFREQSIDHLWGGAWIDGALEFRIRSLCTITSLMSLGHLPELRMHAKGALLKGFWTPDELRAVVLHLAAYIGYPAARHAMIAIEEIVAEIDAGVG